MYYIKIAEYKIHFPLQKYSALCYAVELKKEEIVKELLKIGADVSKTN